MSSTVGKGTIATLVLPIATAQPEAESQAPAAHKVNRSAVILFVDDDPLIAMSTMEMLEDLGHQVIGANSGLHALDIVKSEQQIDLMMTDHVMPGMTGIELAAASRAVRPTLPILLLARVLQGAVAGPLIPMSQALLISSWPKAKSSLALSLFSMIVVTGPIVGPALGGWVTDSYSWSWIFYINIPVGLFAAAMVWLLYRKRDTPARKLPIAPAW